jgi:hypothetical protein
MLTQRQGAPSQLRCTLKALLLVRTSNPTRHVYGRPTQRGPPKLELLDLVRRQCALAQPPAHMRPGVLADSEPEGADGRGGHGSVTARPLPRATRLGFPARISGDSSGVAAVARG